MIQAPNCHPQLRLLIIKTAVRSSLSQKGAHLPVKSINWVLKSGPPSAGQPRDHMQTDRRAKHTAAASLGFIDKDFLLSLWADAPFAATVLCAHHVCSQRNEHWAAPPAPSPLAFQDAITLGR